MNRLSPISGIVALAIGATLISFSGVYVKLADVGPTAAGVYRTFFGGLILLFLVVLNKEKLWVDLKYFLLAVCTGIAFSVDIYCWHKSIHYIGPGFATILGNFQVFILAVYAMHVFKEKPTFRFLSSMILAVAGLFMIAGFKIDELTPSYKIGIILGLITACAYSAYILLLKSLLSHKNRLSPIANLMVASFTTSAILAVTAFAEKQSLVIPDTESLMLMACYGLLSQVVAWILISRSLPNIRTSTAGLILLLQPALAFIWDIVLFGRRADFLSILGALLAIAAIYLGAFKPSSSKNH